VNMSILIWKKNW